MSVWVRALDRARTVTPLRVAAYVLMAPFLLVGAVAALVWFVVVAGVIAGVAEGWSTVSARLDREDTDDGRT